VTSITKIKCTSWRETEREREVQRTLIAANDLIQCTRAHSFPWKFLAKFHGPVHKDPRLAIAKLSKFCGLSRPSVCA